MFTIVPINRCNIINSDNCDNFFWIFFCKETNQQKQKQQYKHQHKQQHKKIRNMDINYDNNNTRNINSYSNNNNDKNIKLSQSVDQVTLSSISNSIRIIMSTASSWNKVQKFRKTKKYWIFYYQVDHLMSNVKICFFYYIQYYCII